jgi:Fe-S cluster assembly iron-binding protein IscA
MKYPAFLAVVLLGIAGCDRASQVQTTRVDPPLATFEAAGDSLAASPVKATESVTFHITDVAAGKVGSVLATVPSATHVVVSATPTDHSCTGYHYSMQLDTNPSPAKFALLESNGIQIAIPHDHVKYLEGATLDFKVLDSGEQGFHFKNPNESPAFADESAEE